ncbi:MAG: TonB-dependent receptor domain-containing protein [Acidobacteriota bacterium]
MGTPRRLLLMALLVAISGLMADAAAQVPGGVTSPRRSPPVTQIAAAATGTIAGIVLDEQGQPLEGVMVSALGGSRSFAVSDRAGEFTLLGLMPGPYLVRAHMDGYLPARGTMIHVRPAALATSTFTMKRLGTAAEPRVVAAATGGVAESAPGDDAESSTRSEGELSWRLRHLKRSILRDGTTLTGVGDATEDWFITDSLQFLGRAVESSARLAGAFFVDSPLTGEVNLLTTGAFDAPADLFQMENTHGVAFFSVGAPVGNHGDWIVKAALNQRDLNAWLLAGNYVTRAPARHRYRLGMSYGVHRYDGGNTAAMAGTVEAVRNVGSVYAHDEWKLADFLTVGYGGHIGHYDYLVDSTHVSPRVTAELRPATHTRVRAVAGRQVTVPGAEEFLPPARTHQVLPPQRTFAPLTRAGFLPEDTRHYEVGLEHDLGEASLGVRAFQQQVDDQLVTIFGLRTGSSPAVDKGHYFVGSAGSVDVRGWGVTFTHGFANHVRGSVDYSMARAQWDGQTSPDRSRLSRVMPGALRQGTEQLHDLTTVLETELPQSATRVFLLYRINNAYVRTDGRASSPGVDGRWDVQVSQRLPFLGFTSAQWEMLVAVRNVFRESVAETSIYDELLVASPPKRLIGGITVRF